jgi:uncharacterized protein (TIRG00374 family)
MLGEQEQSIALNTSRPLYRRRLFFGLRIVVACVLVGVMLAWLDLAAILLLFASLRPGWAALAAVPLLFIPVCLALRWSLLLRDGGIPIPVVQAIRVTYIGAFLGQFFPGAVGPDLVRGYWIANGRADGLAVGTSLIADRLVGVYAIIFVALLAALVGDSAVLFPGVLPALIALQAVALIGWLAAGRLGARLRSSIPRHGKSRWWAKATLAATAAGSVAASPYAFGAALALSIGIFGLRCLVFWLLYRSFGYAVSMGVLAIAIPIMFLSMLLPISISGIGVREATLAALLLRVGVPIEATVSVGVLFQVLLMLTSLPGLFFSMTEKRRTRQAGEPPADATASATALAAG